MADQKKKSDTDISLNKSVQKKDRSKTKENRVVNVSKKKASLESDSKISKHKNVESVSLKESSNKKKSTVGSFSSLTDKKLKKKTNLIESNKSLKDSLIKNEKKKKLSLYENDVNLQTSVKKVVKNKKKSDSKIHVDETKKSFDYILLSDYNSNGYSPSRKLKRRDKEKDAPVFKTSDVALLVLITCIISLLLGGLVVYRFIDKQPVDVDKVNDSDLQAFIDNYNYVVENYYTEVNKKELLDAAFEAIVSALGDEYSGFIDDSESNNFDITLRGSYTGLGVEVVNDVNNNVVVYNIFEDSPAGRSDLQIGDVILRINDQDVSNTATVDFIKVIQDDFVDQFHLVIRRGTEEKMISMNKEFITLQSVVSKTFEKDGKKVGYLGVSIFAANTGIQFRKALTELENQGIDGLVIDLRGNGGGHLFVTESMISEFLDSSHVIYQDETKKNKNKVFSTGTQTKTYPISLLVNGSSASASELMTAALMEEYGAKVIGTTTFGKGTVQELHQASNGEEYKFTVKKWLTPKGNWIHSKGITPDYDVVLDRTYYENPSDESDNQLQKAMSVLFES